MNYIQELNAFECWLETNYLSAPSQLLWYKLICLCNRSGWSEWISVDVQRLMTYIQVTDRRVLVRARDELAQAGLIEYEKGKKGNPSRYKLFSVKKILCVKRLEYGTENGTEYGTENGTEYGTENGTEYGTEYGTERALNILNNNNNKNKNKTKTKHITPIVPYADIVEYFNRLSFPKVLEVSEKRKTAIRAFLKNHTLDDLYMLFDMANGSDFLTGQNNNGWKANFDWILKNAVKVLEGNYANRAKASHNFDAIRRFMEDESIE